MKKLMFFRRFFFITAFFVYVRPNTQITDAQLTLAVTSDRSLLSVYVDGVSYTVGLTSGNNWNVSDIFSIPETSRLLAVRGNSFGIGCPGILTSIGDYFQSSVQWKCLSVAPENWMTLGFDDSTWLNALASDLNDIPFGCSYRIPLPDFSPTASWIWSSDLTVPTNCRGYIPVCTTNNPCQNGGTCLVNSVELCLCPDGKTGQFCEMDIILSVTADDDLFQIFVDGINRPIIDNNSTNWEVPSKFQLSSTARLVAITGNPIGSPCEGILASVTNDYMVSDGNWKCSTADVAETGWEQLGFDDSNWPNAVIINQNIPSFMCPYWTQISGISSNAFWVWTNNINDGVQVNCRGYLPLCSRSPCLNGGTCQSNAAAICICPDDTTGQFCETRDTQMTISVTGDGALVAFYADGQAFALGTSSSLDWTIPDVLRIQDDTRLLAIRGNAFGSACPGILSSIVGYFETNGQSWKCSTDNSAGWFQLGFNDAAWDSAIVSDQNREPFTCSHRTPLSNLTSTAYWIWSLTPTQPTNCRGYTPYCTRSPCMNGGTCLPNAADICQCPVGFIGTFCEIRIPFESLTVAANSHFYSIYVDGQQMTAAAAAAKLSNVDTWSVTLTSDNRVIAISGTFVTEELKGRCSVGIVASTNNYLLLTNSQQWKCSSSFYEGWFQPGFDDSHWPHAVELDRNHFSLCPKLHQSKDINPEAHWIWSDNLTVSAYCRAHLSYP